MDTAELKSLAAELQLVSYHGVGHAMGNLTEDMIPNLAAIARKLAYDPSGRLRVVIALAVRRAVVRLDPPKDMAAAAALLWLDLESDFEDDRARSRKTLTERHPEVAALLGGSLSTYLRRKKWRVLYERVATELLALVAEQPADSSSATPLGHSNIYLGDSLESRPDFFTLAEIAADLHYASVALLLIDEWGTEPLKVDLDIVGADKLCEPLLFEEYGRFLAHTRFLLTNRQCLPVALRSDDELVHNLIAIRRHIQDCLPFDSADDTLLLHFGLDVRRKSVTAYMNAEVTRLYTVYTDWLAFNRIRYFRWADSAGVVQLAAHSRRFVLACSQYMESLESVMTRARRKAYRSVLAHTGESDLVPLNTKGTTFRDWADKRFALIENHLAQDKKGSAAVPTY